MRRLKLHCFTILLTFIFALPDAAAGSIRFLCSFENYATADGIKEDKDFRAEFIHDTVTQKAMMVGNHGLSEVTSITGSYGITFEEILETGAVQTTTIEFETLQSVHSRHTMFQGELFPSQYYGQCVALDGNTGEVIGQ